MQQRSVSDLMTRDVADVRPDTGFKEIVKLLAERDIASVPVVDEERHPLGVVSETDLMRSEARHPDPSARLPEVLQRYVPREHVARRTVAGRPTAGTLMSAPALVAHPEWSVVEAARLMDQRKVKQLPVVDRTDHLVGILSRSDLLRVFLRQDRAIREEITADILTGTFRLAPHDVTVQVVDGEVTLRGSVPHRGTIPVLERLCRAVDGVVGVDSELTATSEEGAGDGATPSGTDGVRRS